MPTSTSVTELKINKLTQSQYESAVQSGIIGENELSVITDVDYATVTTPATIPELVVANWVSSSQTINVDGVTSSNIVIVSPAPASATEYAECGVICASQGSGTLTFTCDSTPVNDIDVNVVCLN